MLKRVLKGGREGVSPIVAIIILLTITITVTAGIIYWGFGQVHSLGTKSDLNRIYSEMRNLNNKINTLSLENVGNTEVLRYSVPRGELTHETGVQYWVLRSESRSNDLTDDFEDGMAEDFVIYMGNLDVESGKMVLESGGTYGIVFASTPKLMDLDISFKVQLTRSSLNMHWCGVELRAPDMASSPSNSGYVVMYTRDGTILIMKNGVVVASTDTGLMPGSTERTMKVTLREGFLKVYLYTTTGWSLVLSYIDATPLPPGYVSFCVGGNNVEATFDNVVIHPVGKLWSPGNMWLSGNLRYNGSGDYAIIKYPEYDQQDWKYFGEVTWHYRVGVDIYTGKGRAENFPIDIDVPFDSLLSPGEKLDRNSIRVVDEAGHEIPYQVGRYLGDEALQSPSLATAIGYEIPTVGANDGGGVLATDGKYLYVKRWGNLHGSLQFQRIGTGLYGTEKGYIYGTINTPSKDDTISAFYHNGYIYNGYTPDGLSIERINAKTGVIENLALSSPLINYISGAEISSASSALLITTDGMHLICVSTGINGVPYSGYRIKMYDFDSGTLVGDFSFSTAAISAEGVICHHGNLYLIGKTGTIVRFSIELGRMGDNFTTWTFPSNDGGMVGGQYDTVNNIIWLSSRNGVNIKAYEGYMPRRLVWISDSPLTPYSHLKYYIYFDTYSNGLKDALIQAVDNPPKFIENTEFKDYTIENEFLRVSLCEGTSPVGDGAPDHIYEVFDKRTGHDLQNSIRCWGWDLYNWQFGGYSQNPYDGITHIVVLDVGINMVELKMVHRYTNFLYERIYTLYRGCEIIKITHSIRARVNLASGNIYFRSWWNPGRGDDRFKDIDSAYGIGGHDFGTKANPLGAEFTSEEYIGLLGWQTPTAEERESAWYVQWNETNLEGIGTIWPSHPSFIYQYRVSENANQEGRGIYLRVTIPGLSAGAVYSFSIYGYVFDDVDGRSVRDMAYLIHTMDFTISSPELVPYERINISSYSVAINPQWSYNALVFEVYFNGSSYPIYTAHIYNIDIFKHTTTIGKREANVLELCGGVFSDYPRGISVLADPMIHVETSAGLFTMGIVSLRPHGTGSTGATYGSYSIVLTLIKRTSYIFCAPSNISLYVSGNHSEAIFEYLYTPYYDYIQKGSPDTEYIGFKPKDIDNPNIEAIFTGRIETLKITYLIIGFNIEYVG